MGTGSGGERLARRAKVASEQGNRYPVFPVRGATGPLRNSRCRQCAAFSDCPSSALPSQTALRRRLWQAVLRDRRLRGAWCRCYSLISVGGLPSLPSCISSISSRGREHGPTAIARASHLAEARSQLDFVARQAKPTPCSQHQESE